MQNTISLDSQSIKATWHLQIDGAARNNPGPAGAGIVITRDNKHFLTKGFFLGHKTNNQAEYYALLIGLFLLKPFVEPNDEIHIVSDSQLLIRQLKQIYRVRDQELAKLFLHAMSFLKDITYKLEHVLREQNTLADKLANEGIDKKIPLPSGFEVFLNQIS